MFNIIKFFLKLPLMCISSGIGFHILFRPHVKTRNLFIKDMDNQQRVTFSKRILFIDFLNIGSAIGSLSYIIKCLYCREI